MNWLLGLLIGIGLGLACFGGLWLTLQHVTQKPRHRILFVVSQMGRLVLFSLVFYVLSRAGVSMVVGGLGGVLIARWHLIRHLGVVSHGK